MVESISLETLSTPETTYNFEVADFHTYYVGEQSICVHNANCGLNELSDDALRNFGESGKNTGFRQINGTHDDALSFVKSQTKTLTEYSPNKFVGYNSRGVEFRVYARSSVNYTSARINGVQGLKGIKFMWAT